MNADGAWKNLHVVREMGMTVDETGMTLRIKEITMDKNGTYRCLAENNRDAQILRCPMCSPDSAVFNVDVKS